MKKVILSLFVCLLITSLSAITAISVPSSAYVKKGELFRNAVSGEDDAPFWAKGNFSGKWGIELDFFGNKADIELGNVSGYYSNTYLGFIGGFIKYGMFSGEFVPYHDDSKATDIFGFYFGPALVGKIGDVEVESLEYTGSCNETWYTGISRGDYPNETYFDWRIIASEGPTFYMKGTFSAFD